MAAGVFASCAPSSGAGVFGRAATVALLRPSTLTPELLRGTHSRTCGTHALPSDTRCSIFDLRSAMLRRPPPPAALSRSLFPSVSPSLLIPPRLYLRSVFLFSNDGIQLYRSQHQDPQLSRAYPPPPRHVYRPARQRRPRRGRHLRPAQGDDRQLHRRIHDGRGQKNRGRAERTQRKVRDYGRGIPLGKLVDCVSIINTGAKYDSETFQKPSASTASARKP